MALDPNTMKADLVDALITANPIFSTMTQAQLDALTDFCEKISIAVTDQILRGEVTVPGEGTFNVT